MRDLFLGIVIGIMASICIGAIATYFIGEAPEGPIVVNLKMSE